MQKFLSLFADMLLLISTAKAHLAEKNTGVIQVGYGYPSVMTILGQMLKFGFTMGTDPETSTSSFSYKGVGPFHGRFEYMLGGRVGLGLSTNFEKGTFTLEQTYTDFDDNFVSSKSSFDYNSINAMARINFHFLKRNEKIDIYYGLGVGYAHTRAKFKAEFDGATLDTLDQKVVDEFNDYLNDAFKMIPVAIESVFGMKWAFTPTAGMYLEAGYSKAFCQLGLFVKLGNTKGYNRTSWKYY